MPRNPHRKGTRASTSFRKDEVDLGLAIFNTVLRGGDATILLNSEAGRKIMAKFCRLKASIAERRSGVELDT